jgi:serine/threonine protein kinase
MIDWIFIPNNLFQEHHCKAFLRRTSTALAYLHKLGVSHNDLSMENFISSDGSNLVAWVENVCICDYGQSKLHVFSDNQFQPLPNTSHLGKAQYYPPEINKGPFYGFKVDVFQLAMTVLYSLLPRLWQDTSRRPHVKDFHNLRNEDEIKIVISMKLKCRPELQLSDDFLQLLCKMLIAKPEDRISMTEVRDHPCLVGY